MKGRKINTEFVVSFIDDSIAKGLNTKNLMLQDAESQIKEIELELKQIHQKKLLRSNLLDVVFTLKK